MAKEVEIAAAKGVDLQLLQQTTCQQIDATIEKTNIAERDVYVIAKEFFKTILELEYEFTHEELLEELHKTYIDQEEYDRLEKFILAWGQIEYQKKTFTQKELKVLLEEMRTVINHLIKQNKTKQSFFKQLIGWNKTIPQAITQLIPRKGKMDETEQHQERHTKKDGVNTTIVTSLRNLMNEAIQEKDAKKAKAIFLESKRIYEELGAPEKNEVYEELASVATQIKNRTQKINTTSHKKSNSKQEKEDRVTLQKNTSYVPEELIESSKKDASKQPQKETTKNSSPEKAPLTWTTDHEEFFPETKEPSSLIHDYEDEEQNKNTTSHFAISPEDEIDQEEKKILTKKVTRFDKTDIPSEEELKETMIAAAKKPKKTKSQKKSSTKKIITKQTQTNNNAQKQKENATNKIPKITSQEKTTATKKTKTKTNMVKKTKKPPQKKEQKKKKKNLQKKTKKTATHSQKKTTTPKAKSKKQTTKKKITKRVSTEKKNT